jgi:asparagine synthase (glutamine-hydrolysing)
MTDTLRHRGPDDAGVWIDEASGMALGFRRLAILELSEAGHQPMVSHDGQHVLVFNGEIYNHAELKTQLEQETGSKAWVGHSDTEILLECCAAWGVRRTVEQAVGMFAFAVWDRGDRRLYLARDRFGEKPLYYGWVHGAFVFGSELKALRCCPGFDNEIDRDVLALYLRYSAVPGPYSIYRDIYKLQPGCILSIPASAAGVAPAGPLFAPGRYGGVTIERYWDLADVVARGLAAPIEDEHEATESLEVVLKEAVRLQSIADVPLGAFLSGGIDSSTIVALMQVQSRRRVRTFTIGFDEPGFDEATRAKEVANHLGTEHTELYVTAQQARDVIPILPDLYSEPFADSSQIPTHLVSSIARPHVTVALSGDGGDELFGGYTRHLWGTRMRYGFAWMPAGMRRAAGAAIQAVPPGTWDRAVRAVSGRRLIEQPGDKAHKLAYRLRRTNGLDGLYGTITTTWPVDARLVLQAACVPTALDALMRNNPAPANQKMMFWDTLTYLPDDILHKVDRASMGVSLETRAPFLDHRVAELAWRMPLRLKIRNGTGKWILRKVLHRHVPPGLVERPKMGFAVPIDAWLRAPLREWAEAYLEESKLRAEGFFDPSPIRQKWAEHLSGRRNWHHELWAVLMFQTWLERQ